MTVWFGDLQVGPGGTIEVDAPEGDPSVVMLTAECLDPECDLHVWFLDGEEVGRGAEVSIEASSIPAGEHEVRLEATEPEAGTWVGTVTLVRVIG